ncbi:F-box/RNI-like superfamily protein [Euphorbia peplus]|nr:F-box/RNI-like superfamily protein [Euphorbia peplus]
MEHLPVEVVGNILSHLQDARDVLIASTTCKKWHQAWRFHLRSLCFNYHEWPEYLSNSELEILITETIFKTSGLQELYILMDDIHAFSAALVISWLMYTRETLRRFHYNARTPSTFNIIEKCGRHKLEELVLAHNSISSFESYQKFPCLKLLGLSYIKISPLNLRLLLATCPKIEELKLADLELTDPVMSGAHATLELTSSSLKRLCIKAINMDKFVLEADNLVELHLHDCTIELFKFIGKSALRVLKIEDVTLLQCDLRETTANLEAVDVSDFTITGPKFYNMVSKSSKLTKLRLWNVVFDNEGEGKAIDVETMLAHFPLLNNLSLNYELRGDVFHGSKEFNNIVASELGWSITDDLFADQVAGLLARCPNLKTLVIHGVVSEAQTRNECQTLANFTSRIVQLMRKYLNVEVEFEYE